jgi:hypothetical protein
VTWFQEVRVQNVMVEEITAKVEATSAQIQNVNVRLKEALDKAGGASRIIVNVVLLLILLAVGGYFATQLLHMNQANT